MVTITIKKSIDYHNQDNSAFVSFNYNKKYVDMIKELPFRTYHLDTKEWEIPLNKVDETKTNFEKFGEMVTIKGDVSLLNNNTQTKEIELPSDFYKTKPFAHQVVGVKRGLTDNSWFLGDEQGLGKTKTVIDIGVARKLIYGYKHCLIVCGVNTLKWNWLEEIKTHSNEDAYILGQKITKKGKLKIGSTKDKLRDLDFIQTMKGNDDLPYFLITNVESFRDENIAVAVQNLCKNNIINMCAADEMHKMKNPTSQQTKGFLKCQPKCKIAMTGTPLMNNPLDLYVILRWLGYENHAFYNFKNHYCIMGGYGSHEILGYRNMPELQSQVQDIMLRRLKKDVLDLPEKLYVDEYVELLSKQSVLYKEVNAGIKTALANGEIDLNNPLSALIRLRQVTGYPGILSDVVKESAKLDRMTDIVEESINNNKKVLIFSNWTQMTDAIYDRLSGCGYGISVITGDTKDEDRQTIVNLFQNESYCNVLIGTIGAMGTGLTLTAASTVIFVDEPWNKALYEQAVDRAHRIGQSNNITIYNLITKDTIDEKIHQLVYKKGLMSDYIIDGHIVGDKSTLLNYLLS